MEQDEVGFETENSDSERENNLFSQYGNSLRLLQIIFFLAEVINPLEKPQRGRQSKRKKSCTESKDKRKTSTSLSSKQEIYEAQ